MGVLAQADRVGLRAMRHEEVAGVVAAVRPGRMKTILAPWR
ncbi:hypothetical protein OG778_29685 [Streptomyces sp. NBC_00184]|nr:MULTISPECIES: hypothetical protein [unclassified Streptomyces]